MPLSLASLSGALPDQGARYAGSALGGSAQFQLGFVDREQAYAVVFGRIGTPVSAMVQSVVDEKGEHIEAACTCELAREKTCEHIWALLYHLSFHDSTFRSGAKPWEPLRLVLVGAERIDRRLAKSLWRRSIARLGVLPALKPPETKNRRIFFGLEKDTRTYDHLMVHLKVQEQAKTGAWGKVKNLSIKKFELDYFPESLRTLLEPLSAFTEERGYSSFSFGSAKFSKIRLPTEAMRHYLPALCATGAFGWLKGEKADPPIAPLSWDSGKAWSFALCGEEVVDDEGDVQVALRPKLVRDDEVRPLTAARIFPQVVLFDDCVAALGSLQDFEWVELHRHWGVEIQIPTEELSEALEVMGQMPRLPDLRLPEIHGEIGEVEPLPQLLIELEHGELLAKVEFLYGRESVAAGERRALIVDRETHKALRRAVKAEAGRVAELQSRLGRPDDDSWPIPAERLVELVLELNQLGWQVLAHQKKVRPSRGFSAAIVSGLDWFDLEAAVDYADGLAMPLPVLLQALRRGQAWVKLDDGSLGLLPTEWLAKYAPLADLATSSEGGKIRFAAHQALLLDALLAAEPEVRIDEVFARARERLLTFDRLTPEPPPVGFGGLLREYQQLGLAWLTLLGELGLGGCLADDMGLGKTVQVLALLLARRRSGRALSRPSLLVVPKSVVPHWNAEASRFAPELEVLVLHGSGRHHKKGEIEDHDVVVTTYGTLLRDIDDLRQIQFDVVVLDEAQTIKNPATNSAKAVRLLHGKQRLALTGTPVENHLGDLWSILEFLNPGLLGSLSSGSNKHSLPALAEHAGKQHLPPAALAAVARALKPLILRRTKLQVLKELPEKTESTLFCELSPKERRCYDELRCHYQAALRAKVETIGLARSKIFVLEALLRLRQAACHGGLVDAGLAKESSAKIDLLIEQLQEVLAEGSKVLVFSQFVKLLAIVRTRLDRVGITYEYLDGKTQDRGRRVKRFQNDPSCPVFLISLKAGGLGLNLTAASYVFLLDPWWNPAVEMQAIDRAHRIGQVQPVFAYRLIAKDTVEEKIAALQAGKKALADAILGGDDGRLMKQLTVEDLELLLG